MSKSNKPAARRFAIPMLARFLGETEANFHGMLMVGHIYTITGYLEEQKKVILTVMDHTEIAVEAHAFEVVRNASWTFAEGHCSPNFEAFSDFGKHDDHVEAMAFDFHPWIGADFANTPDHSAIGQRFRDQWMNDHESSPARPLFADLKNRNKQLENYLNQGPTDDELRTAAFIPQSPLKESHRERFERDKL